MTSSSNILAPLFQRLTRMPLWHAVLLITLVSVGSSMAICGTVVTLFMPWATFDEWGWLAMLVPAFCSSLVAFVIMSLVHELERTRQALARAATMDPLTGIGNRRHFLDRCAGELSNAQRQGLPTSLLMLDIDHFKTINDRWGHQAGDQVLVQLARACTAELRAGDTICRWGGEEFVVLLPATDAQGARVVAEKLRLALSALTLDQAPLAVTVSIGLATGLDTRELDTLIAQADTQLYLAKQSGRDRVMADLALS